MNKNNKTFKKIAHTFNQCAFISLFAFTFGLGFFMTADWTPAWLAAPTHEQSSPVTHDMGLAMLLSKW